MSTASPASPAPRERIDAAIQRIEAATARRREAADDLHRRHETLRARMGEAIAAIDGLLARESEGSA